MHATFLPIGTLGTTHVGLFSCEVIRFDEDTSVLRGKEKISRLSYSIVTLYKFSTLY